MIHEASEKGAKPDLLCFSRNGFLSLWYDSHRERVFFYFFFSPPERPAKLGLDNRRDIHFKVWLLSFFYFFSPLIRGFSPSGF